MKDNKTDYDWGPNKFEGLDIQLADTPVSAGRYEINRTFQDKPSAFHRFFTRILLGWKWVDN